MSFYVYFLCGLAGGVLGGMGMGGGTLLIPLLTAAAGVGQAAAQGVNLLSFLPMSAIALSVHAKNGLLRRADLLFLCVPALLVSVLFSFAATRLPALLLRRGFGLFLIVLAAVRLFDVLRARSPQRDDVKL